MTIIEEQMKANNETTATQLRKLLEDKGFSVSKTTTICARQHLGWTFHGRRYCQIIRVKNKEKRVKWALENAQNSFDSVVWTDESMIQLENHRAFCQKAGESPKPKPKPKNPYKIMVWARISKKGATSICLITGSVDRQVYQDIIRTLY
jgi:hypothetical protein